MGQVHAVCGLPFCQNNEGVQTNSSIALRVTAFVLGLIGIIVGAYMVTGNFGHSVPPEYGWSILTVGIILNSASALVKCIKEPVTADSTSKYKERLRESTNMLGGLQAIENQMLEHQKIAKQRFLEVLEKHIEPLKGDEGGLNTVTRERIQQSTLDAMRSWILFNTYAGSITSHQVDSILGAYLAGDAEGKLSFLSDLRSAAT